MAEEFNKLVVAYFHTSDEAHAAGEQLKEWDKELRYMKLDAISILTMNKKGKLKEEKVGARTGKKGAKWGTIAGAALGILSGGATLIGGAIVGLAAGALGGTLIHKQIGMSDEDQARLESHLKDGGAALAAMMTIAEMEGVITQLQKLDADVATYNVPQQVLDDIERMAKGGKVIHDIAQRNESVEKTNEEASTE